MKYKKGLLVLPFVTLFGCGFVNNVGVIGKNLSRLATPHPYSVKSGDEKKILESGKGIVDLYFTEDIATAWGRIDENGNIDSKNYTLTYNEIGGRGRRKSQLEPGTYFLNGFISNNGIMTGYYVRSVKMEHFGWDKENKRAKCFSFVVKAGEALVIPDIQYDGFSGGKNDICPKLSYSVRPSVNDGYMIGSESKVDSDIKF